VDLGLLAWAPFYDSDAHRWGYPAPGDVIIFDAPSGGGRYVKRVIGLPGDEIRINEGGRVLRNGEPLDEPYAQGPTVCSGYCGPWIVPDDHYFVMGDNRANSEDSREGWYVSLSAISGKVVWHR
jgi:signal peptidase I